MGGHALCGRLDAYDPGIEEDGIFDADGIQGAQDGVGGPFVKLDGGFRREVVGGE